MYVSQELRRIRYYILVKTALDLALYKSTETRYIANAELKKQKFRKFLLSEDK